MLLHHQIACQPVEALDEHCPRPVQGGEHFGPRRPRLPFRGTADGPFLEPARHPQPMCRGIAFDRGTLARESVGIAKL